MQSRESRLGQANYILHHSKWQRQRAVIIFIDYSSNKMTLWDIDLIIIFDVKEPVWSIYYKPVHDTYVHIPIMNCPFSYNTPSNKCVIWCGPHLKSTSDVNFGLHFNYMKQNVNFNFKTFWCLNISISHADESHIPWHLKISLKLVLIVFFHVHHLITVIIPLYIFSPYQKLIH